MATDYVTSTWPSAPYLLRQLSARSERIGVALALSAGLWQTLVRTSCSQSHWHTWPKPLARLSSSSARAYAYARASAPCRPVRLCRSCRRSSCPAIQNHPAPGCSAACLRRLRPSSYAASTGTIAPTHAIAGTCSGRSSAVGRRLVAIRRSSSSSTMRRPRVTFTGQRFHCATLARRGGHSARQAARTCAKTRMQSP